MGAAGGLEVGCLVIETAFRDDETELAARSAHLHPARLRQELAQLAAPTEVCITHLKPGEVETVMAEIAAQGNGHRIRALRAGDEIRLIRQK